MSLGYYMALKTNLLSPVCFVFIWFDFFVVFLGMFPSVFFLFCFVFLFSDLFVYMMQ